MIEEYNAAEFVFCPIHCSHYNAMYSCCNYCEDGKPPSWRQQNGEIILIKNMDTSHIIFTINMLNNKVSKIKQEINFKEYPFASIKFLKEELKKRNLNRTEKKLCLRYF